MRGTMRGTCVFATCLVAGLLTACSHSEAAVAGTWSPKAAAAYLDQRETWWMGWHGAARDHDTFCVSCHTAVSYALSRSALRGALADESPSVNERKLLENVTKRVRLWKEVGPYYGDQAYGAHKTEESRATEAVLNALSSPPMTLERDNSVMTRGPRLSTCGLCSRGREIPRAHGRGFSSV